MHPSCSDRRRRAAGWAALLLALAAPARAWAEPEPEDAEHLIARGVALRAHGDDAAAFEPLRQAYEDGHTARAAAQLGFVEQALGRWVGAEVHLAEALAAGGDPWIRKNAAMLEESLRFVRGHLGAIAVDAGVRGATVTVDGAAVGQTPLPWAVRAETGERRVEIEAAGYRNYLTAVTVRAGETARVQAELAPLPPPLQAVPPETAPAPRIEARPEASSARPVPIYKSGLLWASVAVVAIAAGVVVAMTASGGGSYPCGGGDRVCAR